MKKSIKYMLFIGFMFAAQACTDSFEEINTNPNQPEEVTADLLLSKVITTAAIDISLEGWNEGNIVAQHTAKIIFTGFDIYDWGSNNDLWEVSYNNLRDIKNILEIAEGNGNEAYQAVALVMRAWTRSVLTDLWGDVPSSEATSGKSDGIFQPRYDTQEDIYNSILEDLRTANALLADNPSVISGDLLYGGDLSKWRKFANSLRLRYLIRISGKKNVDSEIQSVAALPLMESNEDNAILLYGPQQPDTWPVHTSRVGSFDEYRLSLTIQNILESFDDPRLQLWFRPTDNPNDDPGLFAGMPNGLSEDNASNYNGGAQNVSRCSRILYEEANAVDAIFMQQAEVQFLLAEAAQRGIISGNAQQFYEDGIRASFHYWDRAGTGRGGLTASMPGDYLDRPGVAYDGSLETIIKQKWLAFFLTGYEAWLDFRRTGFPSEIVPGPDNKNGNRVPVRFLYPSDQQTLNPNNYGAAIARQGEDNINTRMWYLQ